MKSKSINALPLLLLGCKSAKLVEGEYTGNWCRNTSIYDTGEEWEELDCEIESIEDLKLSISIPLIGAPKYSLSSSNGEIGEGKLDQLPEDEWYNDNSCGIHDFFVDSSPRTYLIEESLDLDGRLIQSPALTTDCAPYGHGWRSDGVFTVTLFEQNEEGFNDGGLVCGNEGHCIDFRMVVSPSE